MDRDEEGRPKLKPPGPAPPGAEQLFRRRCYYLGITEPARVDRLWTAERARVRAEHVKGRRHE